jgi:uncharacterized protein
MRTVPFLQRANSARRRTHPVAAVLLTPLFLLVGAIGGSLLAFGLLGLVAPGGVGEAGPLQAGAVEALFLISSFAPGALLLWLWLRLFEGRPFRSLGFTRPGALRSALGGFALGAGLFALLIAAQAALGFVRLADPGRPVVWAALGGVLVVLVGWLVQGSVEELMLRGWVFQSVGARTPPWVAVLVSSLLFALLHGINPGITPLALLNLTLFGVFAALFVLAEGSLWGVCGLHAAWNWAQGNLFDQAVSGGETAISLLDLERAPGPAWLTGGDFGPEGSALCSALLLAGCAVLLALLRRRGATSADPLRTSVPEEAL